MTVEMYGSELLEHLSARAAGAPRRRQHLNLHLTYDDECQRLFNAIGVDSYIPPHRHSLDPKTETLIAVQGLMTLVVFDDLGEITRAVRFGAGTTGCGADCFGVEIPAGVWHTVIAEVPGSVLFEVKAGPFDPAMAKEFAPWAAAEGSNEAKIYLEELRAAADRVLSTRGTAGE